MPFVPWSFWPNYVDKFFFFQVEGFFCLLFSVMLFKLQYVLESSMELVKIVSYRVCLGWGLIFSISSKLLDDSDVASLWATLQSNRILNDCRWTYILIGFSNEILCLFFTLTLQGRKCRCDFSLHMRRVTEYLCPTQELISNKWKGKSNIYWVAAVCCALKVSV